MTTTARRIWTVLEKHATKLELAKKEPIIEQGTVCDCVYFVESGCVRSWFNQDGKDISFQFFMPESMFSACDSLLFNDPSPFSYETLLPTTVYSMSSSEFKMHISDSPELVEESFRMLSERLRHYQRLFLSRIKNTPQERYQELIETHPEIVRTIPQHYIASYLGITSVSLSRIRCKKQ